MASAGGTRARRAPLSKERVIAEAVALADASGIEALTMRKLADRLGVEPMSLYHHVAGKDTILDTMVDVVFAEIPLPEMDIEWKAATRNRAAAVRSALRRHRWAVGLMESRLTPGLATLRHHDAMIGCLRGARFTIAQTAHALSAIDSYTYGFAMQELNLPFQSAEESAAMAETFLQQFPAELFPHLAELTVEHVLQPDYDYGDEFAFGLDLILDGLEQYRTKTSTLTP